MTTNQVTVGTGATLILAAVSSGGPVNARRVVTVTNLGTVDVYLGAAGVTTGTGDLLVGIKGASKTMYTNGAIYGIAGSSQAVSYSEENE